MREIRTSGSMSGEVETGSMLRGIPRPSSTLPRRSEEDRIDDAVLMGEVGCGQRWDDRSILEQERLDQ